MSKLRQLWHRFNDYTLDVFNGAAYRYRDR